MLSIWYNKLKVKIKRGYNVEERELFWPTEEDVKAVSPNLTPEELERASKRLFESMAKIRPFIETIEKSAHVTNEEMEVSYT